MIAVAGQEVRLVVAGRWFGARLRISCSDNGLIDRLGAGVSRYCRVLDRQSHKPGTDRTADRPPPDTYECVGAEQAGPGQIVEPIGTD